MKKLYRFYYDYSMYSDFISGLFIEEEEVVNQSLGKTLLFKFGESTEEWIEFEFEDYYLTEIDISNSSLHELDKIFNGHLCGHNPLDYLKK